MNIKTKAQKIKFLTKYYNWDAHMVKSMDELSGDIVDDMYELARMMAHY